MYIFFREPLLTYPRRDHHKTDGMTRKLTQTQFKAAAMNNNLAVKIRE